MADTLTLKEYAEQSGISYEAVRRLIDRHAQELDGHIITQSGARYLDDTARRKLDSIRKRKPIVVLPAGSKDANEMEAQLAEQAATIQKLQARILEMMEEKAELLGERTKYAAALEMRAALEDRLTDTTAELKGARERLDDTRDQLSQTAGKLSGTEAQLTDARERLADTEKRLDDTRDQLNDTTNKLAGAQAQLDAFQRTIFGFYRKR